MRRRLNGACDNTFGAALRDRSNDLLEPRRISRRTFVCTLVAVTVATGLLDVSLIAERPAWSGLIKAAILWPDVPAAFVWLYGAPLKALPGQSSNDHIPILTIAPENAWTRMRA